MAYCKDFHPDDIDEVDKVTKEFVESVRAYNGTLLNKVKFHLLLHLPQNMLDFGPTAAYNAERYNNNIITYPEFILLQHMYM